ncbi:MAG: dienelactone hydrolase family protein [Polyangiaceae bacterium]|nr:dienelactone hydrolase family protein [Polyangiaceae bacterium]
MEKITFPTALGPGAGSLACPTVERAPAVLVVHEWWGLNADIEGLAERLAAEGFVALAVDLYGGRSTTEGAVAMQLAQELRSADAMAHLAGAAAWLRADPRTNGKVGITGFCLGGAMALAAAFQVPGLGAAVPFYGNPRGELVDFAAKTPPIQGHYAAVDGFVDVERTRTIAEGVRAAGGVMELHVYPPPAGHAFMRASDPAVYHAASAALAWGRAVAFLRQHLG